MSLYREFSTLLPYIQSVRKLKEFLSFDVSFPSTWKLPKKFVREDRVVEQESKIPNERMISFVSEITEEDVETTYKNIQSIIIEGGAKLLQSFIDKQLWDEARVITNQDLMVNEGLNAPAFSGELIEEEKIFSDSIQYFIPGT